VVVSGGAAEVVHVNCQLPTEGNCHRYLMIGDHDQGSPQLSPTESLRHERRERRRAPLGRWGPRRACPGVPEHAVDVYFPARRRSAVQMAVGRPLRRERAQRAGRMPPGARGPRDGAHQVAPPHQRRGRMSEKGLKRETESPPSGWWWALGWSGCMAITGVHWRVALGAWPLARAGP
jgi:hypothetical protein